jgi:hypothetical protein
MPVELGIWRINGPVQRLRPTSLDAEERLEKLLHEGLGLLDDELLVLGRQVQTDFGKRIDLLGLDIQGNIVVVELKRGRSPRDAVAQLLDYGSWVRQLSRDRIDQVFEEHGKDESSLEEAFDRVFGGPLPDTLNEGHRLILVASELDPATERILQYLGEDFAVPVNAVFFQYFKDGGQEYLTRTWFRDPRETDVGVDARGKTERWNKKDFYVSVGEGTRRSWDDMQRYGFVSGGGGRWFSKTLELLYPGARVFALIPGSGYVGVGIVREESRPVTEFEVEVDGVRSPLLDLPLNAPRMGEFRNDPERVEHVARVDWVKTLPRESAIWEPGMFANQNTVCRLRNRFTLERLNERFGLEESERG